MSIDRYNKCPSSVIPMDIRRYAGVRSKEFQFLYDLSCSNPPSLAVLRLLLPFICCTRVVIWNRDIELHYDPNLIDTFSMAKSLLTRCGCVFSYFCDDSQFAFISIDSVSFFRSLISLAYVNVPIEDSRFRR